MINHTVSVIFSMRTVVMFIAVICSLAPTKKPDDGDTILGMRIESVDTSTTGVVKVVSTGSVITIEPLRKTITLEQRIPQLRTLGHLTINDPSWWDNFSSLANSSKFEVAYGLNKDRQLVVSGDSVLRIYGTNHLTWQSDFVPAHQRKEKNSRAIFLLDDKGGVVIAPPYKDLDIKSIEVGGGNWEVESTGLIRVIYVGICPPKQFDWERSLKPVVHYSSHVARYPSDDQIKMYSEFACVLELHSWIWKNRYSPDGADDEGHRPPRTWWDFSWIAPGGKWIAESETEMSRVVATAHHYGMRVIPYVNFDMAQTPQELQGPDSRFLELRGLIERYKFDGFYLDGLYLFDADASYRIIRDLRTYLGKSGWLTHHNSESGFPFLDCYADLIVTGEHSKFDRWTCTSYNISNSFAAIWPEVPLTMEDGRKYLTDLTDQSIKTNNRMLFLAGEQGQWRDWRLHYTPLEWKMMKDTYLPALKTMAVQPNTAP